MKFFHKLLNPHCPDCKADEQDKLVNPVIELLREENARLVRHNEELLHELVHGSSKPIEPVERDDDTPRKDWKPLQRNHQPWRVKQQMLELEDRSRAKVLADAAKLDAELKKVTLADLDEEIAEVREKIHG